MKGAVGGGKNGVKRKEALLERKIADFSSKGNKKEYFDVKPKADDRGDRPFAMRRSRCS